MKAIMKTSEIINSACTELGITRAELAKRMGIYPSSLYRKITRESMTLEELQKCLDVLGVEIAYTLRFPDGHTRDSQENHELLLEKLSLTETELSAAKKATDFHKKALRDLRTDLTSAVGYAELGGKRSPRAEEYMAKLQAIHAKMEATIARALGEEPAETPDPKEPENIEALKGKRILITDDNDLNREILKEVLAGYGLLVEEAANGREAVEAVKRNEPSHYSFILMDIEMDVMDGYEATAKIRSLPNRIRANIPIIALTVNTVPEERERALSIGMDDFIAKPANSARLLRSLVKFL